MYRHMANQRGAVPGNFLRPTRGDFGIVLKAFQQPLAAMAEATRALIPREGPSKLH